MSYIGSNLISRRTAAILAEDPDGVVSEKIYRIRQERGGYRSSLTKKEHEIRDLMLQVADITSVNERLTSLKNTMAKFHGKHVQYRSLIESDASEVALANEYYESTRDHVYAFIEEVEDWAGHVSSKSVHEYKVVDEIKPEDSASQVKSGASSIDSALVKAKAKRAMLLARAQALKKQHEIKRKQLELQQQEQMVEMEAEIAVAEAEETIYSEYGNRSAARSVEQTKLKEVVSKSEMEQKCPKTDKLAGYASNPKTSEFRMNAPVKVENDTYDSVDKTRHREDSEFMLRSLHEQQRMMQNLQSQVDRLSFGRDIPSPADTYTHVPLERTFFRPSELQNNTQMNPNERAQDRRLDAPETAQTMEERLITLQQRMLDVVQLPKADLMTFDGNPLKYWTFVRAFDSSVGMTSVTDNVKLNRLFQYCTGRALEVIQCCSLMAPDEGYIQARRLLKERFGNDYEISKSWINRVTDGPSIKPYDKDALRIYADDVRSCMLTLSAMGKLAEVDNQPRMVKLVEKLPLYLQGRWRKKVVDRLRTEGTYPDIRVLSLFIETAAQEMNDSVFGSTGEIKKSDNRGNMHRGSNFGRKQGASFNIRADSELTSTSTDKSETERFPSCHLCNGNHVLFRCDSFKQMQPDKRLDFVREKKLCFNCFSPKHVSGSCQKPSRCSIQGCTKKHSRLLHVTYMYQQSGKLGDKRSSSSDAVNLGDKPRRENVTVHSSTCNATGLIKIVLPIVPVKVRANKDQPYVTTYALLDSGSTNTFCSRALIEKLGIQGTSTSLTLTTLGIENDRSDTVVTSLEVADTDERSIICLPYVFSISKLPVLTDNVVDSRSLAKWPHLDGISFPYVDGESVTLLIGQDVPSALIPVEIRKGADNEPYATRAALGWTVNGPLQVASQRTVVSNFVHTDQGLQSQVEQFWKMETCESLDETTPQMSVNDKRVLDIWERSVEIVDGHYQMDIPFRNRDPALQNDYMMARSRLDTLKRKLVRQPDQFERYHSEIHALLDKGFAEKVPTENVSSSKGKVWYLPHHAVTHVNKPDKVRVVFDCSAKFMESSLNDVVLQGPDMTNSLIGVLLRFRENDVAVMGDVEAMFHQVKVSPDDRDSLRFLWWKNDDMDEEPEIFRMTVHLFGGVWSPSCASFALRRTAADNAADFDMDVVQTVNENFYVDDCLKSVETVAEGIRVVDQLQILLKKGGFNLTKWVSNRREVLQSIPQDHRAKAVKQLDRDLPGERALGVHWDTQNDQFGFKITSKERPHTRRGLMSVVSSVYDPFGFICPLVFQAKKIVQSECKSRKGWDEPLEHDNQQRWLKWTQELPKLEQFTIDRCMVPSEFGVIVSRQLHHFGDASLEGYGTASYLRVVNSEGRIWCAFVMGRSRLAPIKPMTIPRLELSAAVLAVKVDRLLRRELRIEIHDSVFWTDSVIVLHYISSTTRRFQMFVANRVATIHDGSRPNQWRYVESSLNPADDASRGLDADAMLHSERWIEGPSFLSKDESAWPALPNLKPEVLEGDSEVRQNAKVHSATSSAEMLDGLFTRYSSWYKLKKCIAWLLRFKTLLFDRTKSPSTETFQWNRGNLTVSEIDCAENEIVRLVQNQCFGDELEQLHSRGSVKRSSSLYKLEPTLNTKGILCVRGRLGRAPIDIKTRHPMILPKNHPIVSLIVRHYHQCLGHSGREHVLSEVRERYWLIRARTAVRRELRNCVKCQRLHGRLGTQRMADLPVDRVTPGKPPYSYVTVD